MSLILLLTLIALGVAYLAFERVRLDRDREAIPLMIAVTGTRGKTSVTRMLAAVLRESGRRVLAKTTGSEAALILPDGTEQPIRRRGRPSIIEQKRVVRLGAQLGVDVAVVEVMSIHPENRFVEARQLLRPDLVLATNFRVDHTAALGETRGAVAAALALDVPPGARVFVPQRECEPTFRTALQDNGGELIEVQSGVAAGVVGAHPGRPLQRLGANLDLVCGVARSLGIDEGTIREGIGGARGDIGSLGIWRYRSADLGSPCFLVNAFAANDPESTMLIHEGVMAALGIGPERCVGLLSLRPDRGDRTLQWLGALREGILDRFSRLYVLGQHAPALAMRLRGADGAARIEVLRGARPAEITRRAASGIGEAGGAIFGFGNIGGLGEALVAHWRGTGEAWEVED